MDGLISATAPATASATAIATHPSIKEAALRAAPPCVDSFMDGCVAVAVAEAETVSVAVSVAETVAVAEINPSTICDQTR